MGDPYVVEVKPSARRAARAAGEWVAERGRYRAFDSKPLAHEWARSVAPRYRPRSATHSPAARAARRAEGFTSTT